MGIIQSVISFLFPPHPTTEKALRFIQHKHKPRLRERQEGMLYMYSLRTPECINLIHAFKYYRHKPSRDFIQKGIIWALNRLIKVHGHTRGIPVITFVPPRHSRIRTIGYDQGEFLLKQCAFNNIHLSLLKRTQHSKQQARIREHNQRMHNMNHVFIVNQSNRALIKNNWIIVIDDIYTSGATFIDIQRALYNSGAHTVTCLAIAH
jgi:predicted amidophosphoribosyltransferase